MSTFLSILAFNWSLKKNCCEAEGNVVPATNTTRTVSPRGPYISRTLTLFVSPTPAGGRGTWGTTKEEGEGFRRSQCGKVRRPSRSWSGPSPGLWPPMLDAPLLDTCQCLLARTAFCLWQRPSTLHLVKAAVTATARSIICCRSSAFAWPRRSPLVPPVKVSPQPTRFGFRASSTERIRRRLRPCASPCPIAHKC